MFAMSSGWHQPRSALSRTIRSTCSFASASAATRSVRVAPGAMAFTRTPCSAYSAAIERVMLATPALRRRIAIASTERHEGDVGRRVDDRAASGLDELGDPILAAEKGAEEIEADDPPELFFGGLGDWPVDLGGATRVVVHHVEPAELVHRPVERGPDASGIGNVGLDPEGFAARGSDPLRRFRAGGRVDLGHHDARAFAGEQFRRTATDARPRAGDECDLAFEPIGHDVWFPG